LFVKPKGSLYTTKWKYQLGKCLAQGHGLQFLDGVQLFSEVIKWSKQENGTSFSPPPFEILVGLELSCYPQGANKSSKNTNFTLLFTKYYLYTQKLLKREINLKEFIRKLTSKLQIEKLSQVA